ncbi:MAG: cytochrome c3 family protein [Oryzomonas sp.]|uniref:cytochrome c3 family protein n=1 Tax=Oryzomonas sp. TaxID=2855186 RepID=UPI0028443B9E|nr:cytochrome c3 family protein [Oryzomonas sp.]MDR3579734.1 cytochrome c3 family protein [Oryzomonas sp.]
MHKRILAILTLLCAIPLLAFAGTGQQQINTWVRSAGGTLQVDSYPSTTSKNGSLWQSYSSSTTNNTVTITPSENYFVNSLIIDGVPQDLTSLQVAGTVLNSSNVSALAIGASDAAPSVWVDFLRSQLSFTVNTGANYIVFPSGAQPNVYAGATFRVFEFIPAKGQYISAINTTGTIRYTTQPSSLPAAANQKVIVTVSSITTSGTLSATVAGTAAQSSVPTTAATIAQVGRACDACHIAQGLDPKPSVPVFASWSASAHKAAGVACADCHQGASTGAHPGIINTTLCQNCHDTAASGGIPTGNPHSPLTIGPAATTSGHPAVPLYTYEEVGMQMAGGAKVQVQVDANGKGMPYSPKQTCGSTKGCHIYNNADYSYDKISDTAFHSHEGRAEYMDLNKGKLMPGLDKPWVQSTAMVGKW